MINNVIRVLLLCLKKWLCENETLIIYNMFIYHLVPLLTAALQIVSDYN